MIQLDYRNWLDFLRSYILPLVHFFGVVQNARCKIDQTWILTWQLSMGACWRPQILVGHGKRTFCFFLNLAGITSVWLHITTIHHLTILRNYTKPIFMYSCTMLRCWWLFSLFMQTCKFSCAALYRKVRLVGCLGVCWIFMDLQCVCFPTANQINVEPAWRIGQLKKQEFVDWDTAPG